MMGGGSERHGATLMVAGSISISISGNFLGGRTWVMVATGNGFDIGKEGGDSGW